VVRRENESHRWGGFFWFLFLQRGYERPLRVKEKKRSSDGGRQLLFFLARLGRDEF